MILIIDDLRNLKADAHKGLTANGHDVQIVRNSEQALDFLTINKDSAFHAIYLDHDLGLVEGKLDNIMPVIDYLTEKAYNDDAINVKTIYVHTSNPVGGNQMVQSLRHYGYNVVRIAPETIFTV